MNHHNDSSLVGSFHPIYVLKMLEDLWFTSNKIKDDTERKMLQGVAKEKNPTIRKVNARRLSRGGD